MNVKTRIPSHVPAKRVVYFDFRHDPTFLAHPWSTMSAMNDVPDIFWSPELGGYWVIARNTLVDEFLQRHDLFSTKNVTVPALSGTGVLIPNNLDPPTHGLYRRVLMQKVFSPRMLATLEREFRTLSMNAVETMISRGACDFMDAYARPVPVKMFLGMLGLPLDDIDQLLAWVQSEFHAESTDEQVQAFAESAAYLGSWLEAQTDDAVTRGRGYVLAALLEASIEGRRLTHKEILAMVHMLFFAGLGTVTSSMSHIMHFLAGNPAHRQLLLDEPSLIPDATEEMLRRFGISNVARVTLRDCEFHGVQFRKGDMVLYSTAILGLDKCRYQEPLSVDFRRKDKKNHLAFGTGPHMCPAHSLVRMELRVMIEETLPRLTNLRIEPDARLAYESGSTLTLKCLPLRWDSQP